MNFYRNTEISVFACVQRERKGCVRISINIHCYCFTSYVKLNVQLLSLKVYSSETTSRIINTHQKFTKEKKIQRGDIVAHLLSSCNNLPPRACEFPYKRSEVTHDPLLHKQKLRYLTVVTHTLLKIPLKILIYQENVYILRRVYPLSRFKNFAYVLKLFRNDSSNIKI